MRSVLMALVALALLGLNASASVPDPDYCTVLPQDNWVYPKLVGVPQDGALRADGDITVHVAAYGGVAIGNCEVLVVINSECEAVTSECDSWDNPGYTDGTTGNLTMNLRFGGCCEMDAAATIYADGTPIRTYAIINSPDWNGLNGGDGQVLLEDFGQFARSYGGTNPCADYQQGDNNVLLEDFGFFARHYGDQCVVTP